ncbi:hypothetical protein FQZ97_931430 [compost metagenome]
MRGRQHALAVIAGQVVHQQHVAFEGLGLDRHFLAEVVGVGLLCAVGLLVEAHVVDLALDDLDGQLAVLHLLRRHEGPHQQVAVLAVAAIDPAHHIIHLGQAHLPAFQVLLQFSKDRRRVDGNALQVDLADVEAGAAGRRLRSGGRFDFRKLHLGRARLGRQAGHITGQAALAVRTGDFHAARIEAGRSGNASGRRYAWQQAEKQAGAEHHGGGKTVQFHGRRSHFAPPFSFFRFRSRGMTVRFQSGIWNLPSFAMLLT